MPSDENAAVARWLYGQDPLSQVTCEGPFRVLTHSGRRGVNPTSLHSRFSIDAPRINADRGTLSLWVLMLEEVSTQAKHRHMLALQPDFQEVPLLTDHREVREVDQATFALAFKLGWYPHFFAKRSKGTIYPHAYRDPKSGIVALGHFAPKRETWYHVAYTWDKQASDYRIYLNGVLAGTSIRQKVEHPLRFDTGGDTLFGGHPKVVLSDIRLHESPLAPEAIRSEIDEDKTPIDPEVQAHLELMYAGVNIKPVTWQPPGDWETVVDLPLTGSGSLAHFHVQGNTDSPSETDEGLRVQTPFVRTPKPEDWDDTHSDLDEPFDVDQMYLWLEHFFEGDIYFSYEFKSRSDQGLGLLCAQASGLHGEDFMVDHPRRVSGSMRMVYGENVRNYHWEYYRHMGDCRHDVASSGLLKQPWQWPLAYQCLDHTLPLEQWHKLEFIHVGDRIIGGINGLTMFDVEDSGHTNNGPVFRRGRFGLRCMWKTDLTYRNLRVMQPRDVFPPR